MQKISIIGTLLLINLAALSMLPMFAVADNPPGESLVWFNGKRLRLVTNDPPVTVEMEKQGRDLAVSVEVDGKSYTTFLPVNYVKAILK